MPTMKRDRANTSCVPVSFLGKAKPLIGAREGVQLMQIIDAIYKSSETGKSVEIR